MTRQAFALAVGLLAIGPVWQACAPVRPWNQVLLLEQPEQGERAERALRAMGPDGWRAVLQAARALGPEVVAREAFRARGCIAIGFPTQPPPVPGEAAVRLAARWLSEEPARAQDLARSPSPALRVLAMSRWIDRPAGLIKALGGLEREKSPAVLAAANQAVDCGLFAMSRSGVKPDPEQLKALVVRKAIALARLNQLRKQRAALDHQPPLKDCRDPKTDQPDGLLEHLLAGRLEVGGSSSSNGVLSIGAAMGKDQASLGPACAVWLYEQAAGHQAYHPGLLTPLVGQMAVIDSGLRRRAADLLARDESHYDPDKRNRLLALAIDAGAKSTTPVTWDKQAYFPPTIELEAAARQGSDEARQAIARAMLCRSARGLPTDGPIPLLGFLPADEVADTVYRIGAECRGGSAAALIALLRLGDPRAVELLDRLLSRPVCCPPGDLLDALAEIAPQGVLDHLRQKAQSGNAPAAKLLDQLSRARDPAGEVAP